MRFQIDYDDPETGERKTHIGDYKAWLDYTPRQEAEYHAYALSDKAMGSVTIRELKS